MSLQWKPLKDLIKINYGKALKQAERVESGKWAVYGSSGQIGTHIASLTEEATIIIGRKGSVGNITYAPQGGWTIDTAFYTEIVDPNSLDWRYLYYALVNLHLVSFTITTSIPGINRDAIYRTPILLPPLADQKRIAAILDKADTIRRKHKQVIKLNNEFLNANFLQMFGKYLHDKSTHKELGMIADFIDYRGKTPPRVSTGIPLINAKCVRPGYFDDARIDYIEEDTYNKVMTRGYPRSGDVLFTTEGATMGYTCRIPADYNVFSVGQRLITLQCKNNYYSVVLEYFLNHPLMQEEIKKRATGSAAQGIRSAELSKITIPFPPIHLQKTFSIIAEKTENIGKKLIHTEPEDLFNSLTKRAFRGEL